MEVSRKGISTQKGKGGGTNTSYKRPSGKQYREASGINKYKEKINKC